MLNLQTLNNISIPITWIDGTLVKLNQPSFKFMKDVVTVQEDDIDGMSKVVLDIMNNNTSGRKFKKAEVEGLNISQVMAIVGEITNFKAAVDSDPN